MVTPQTSCPVGLTDLVHAVRGRLGAIRNCAELLVAAAPADPAERLQFLRIIVAEAERVTDLLDDLLILDRTGAQPSLVVKCPLATIVEGAVHSQSREAERLRVMLQVEPPTVASHVDGDPNRLVRALAELVENAIKFSPDQGTVTISSALEDAHSVIAVEDEGPGVAEDLADRIFEPFYQGLTADQNRSRGDGLGLAIARVIARGHGGDVRVVLRSKGARFELLLPQSDPSE